MILFLSNATPSDLSNSMRQMSKTNQKIKKKKKRTENQKISNLAIPEVKNWRGFKTDQVSVVVS